MSITAQPKDYQVLFLDMNSFFASVEQQVRPELRGKPVGVAPYTGSSGCIIAASREAKAMGVKICRVGEARSLCPNLRVLEARPALYLIYHREIKKVLDSFSPQVRPLSIDEFIIHLDPREQNREVSLALARKIKNKIKREVGDYLTCSVGLGPNYFLAKVAGERRKPDGLTAVELRELESFYTALPSLTELPGINFRLEKRLKNFKVCTPLALYQTNLGEMTRILHHMGRLWYYRLRGFEVDEAEVKTKTVGHSHVLAPELRTKEGVLSVMEKLVMKTGYRLRKGGFLARGVAISIHFTDHTNYSLSRKTAAFSDNKSLRDHLISMLKDCPWSTIVVSGQLVRQPIYLAVSTFNLVRSSSRQISIFPDIEKSEAFSRVLDSINDQYGAGTIFPASMEEAKESAPDRIPFGQPRYEIRE